MANAFKDYERFDKRRPTKQDEDKPKAEAEKPRAKSAPSGKVSKQMLRDQTGLGAMDKMKAASAQRRKITESGNTGPSRIADYEDSKPKKQSFSSAYASARKAGKDTFTWNGKSYSTDRAEDKKADEPMPTGNIGSRVMFEEGETAPAFKRGGGVKKYAKGGSVRGDGCAQRGKTKGKMY